jgi:2-polyprenyl-3-methyl-5-hydroxy-6-metoxy-1,4-benzoquinol methylase
VKKKLISFYNEVYKKGERKHYTKLLFAKGLPNDVKEVLKEVKWRGKTVVDVGCGTGLVDYHLAKKGAKVLGIDFSKNAVQIAKSTYKHPNLEFRCMDVKKLTGVYDVIISLGVIEHMENPLSVMRHLKKHVRQGGSIIVVCPNWTNPRGYILLTLWHLFKAPITRADRHYLTPIEFKKWSKLLGMKLDWRTFDYDWAHGEKLLKDFKRRLPNVLRDAKLPKSQKRVSEFIKWIETHILPLNHKTRFSGASGIYHFRKIR